MTTIQKSIQQLAGTRRRKKKKLTSKLPEQISGTTGLMTWPQETAASTGGGGGSQQEAPAALPEYLMMNVAPDIERPDEFQSLPENPKKAATFSALGIISNPKVPKPEFHAFTYDGKLVFITRIEGGPGEIIDRVEAGSPNIINVDADLDYRVDGFFNAVFDMDAPEYVSGSGVKAKLASMNEQGERIYYVQAGIGLRRNLFCALEGSDLDDPSIGIGSSAVPGYSIGDLLQISDSSLNEHRNFAESFFKDRLTASGFDAGSAEFYASAIRLFMSIAIASRYRSQFLRNSRSMYWASPLWKLRHAAAMFAPGVSDFFKVTVSHQGLITGYEKVHESSISEYVPYMPILAYFMSAQNIGVERIFEPTIGRTYRTKADFHIDESGGIGYLELTASFTRAALIEKRNGSFLPDIGSYSDADSVHIPAGLELGVERYGKRIAQTNDGHVPDPYYLRTWRWPGGHTPLHVGIYGALPGNKAKQNNFIPEGYGDFIVSDPSREEDVPQSGLEPQLHYNFANLAHGFSGVHANGFVHISSRSLSRLNPCMTVFSIEKDLGGVFVNFPLEPHEHNGPRYSGYSGGQIRSNWWITDPASSDLKVYL